MIAQLIFAVLLGIGVFLFTKRIAFVRRNIRMGRDVDLSDRKSERWKTMARVAIGQSKMVARPVAGILHILVYAGLGADLALCSDVGVFDDTNLATQKGTVSDSYRAGQPGLGGDDHRSA